MLGVFVPTNSVLNFMTRNKTEKTADLACLTAEIGPWHQRGSIDTYKIHQENVPDILLINSDCKRGCIVAQHRNSEGGVRNLSHYHNSNSVD